MKIRSKLFLNNLMVGLIAISINIFFISQLTTIQVAIKTISNQQASISTAGLLQSIGVDFLGFLSHPIIILILGVLISLIIILFLNWFFLRRLFHPLFELKYATQEIIKGNLEKKVEVKSKDEFGDLAEYFNKISEKLKKNTEQTKYAEEEKTKTNALLAGIGEGVIATDVNKNIIFMNRVAEGLIGWESGEVKDKPLQEVLTMVDEKNEIIPENRDPFHLALRIGQSVISSIQKNYFYKKRNGEKFPVNISVTPVIMDGKLIGAIDVFRDITHEKEVDTAKTEFVSLASHQLRTPLTSINWYTEMLLAGDAGKITKTQKQYMKEVHDSNKRMVELVNSLLNVSRIDLGTFAIIPELCDMSEVSKSVLMELTPMIKSKKMKIEENYSKSVGKIKLDPKLIRIVFQNLLSNAVKYTPVGGKILISIDKEDNDALIKVQDNGYGISEKDKPKIFGKLFRADNIKDKEVEGTGLGLYIIKSIIQQSGGQISFDSQENKGTTFYIRIPLTGMKIKEGIKGLS